MLSILRHSAIRTHIPAALFAATRCRCIVPTRASSSVTDAKDSSKVTPPYRVLFFGSDDFATKHLAALYKDKNEPGSVIQSIEVVTPPDQRIGRKLKELTPMPTKAFAELHNLPVHHTPLEGHSLTDWQLPTPRLSSAFDLGVVVSFGYFLPPHILHAFHKGIVNVHPSLLPKYRGAAPIQYTVLNNDTETGITVQELDENVFDAGRILAQEVVKIPEDQPVTYKSLVEDLGNKGASLLMKTIRNFDECMANAKTQDPTQVTKAPKITKKMAEVNFETMSAEKIEQLHRAIGHQCPLTTTYTLWRIKRSLKIKHRHISMQLLNIFLPTSSPAHGVIPYPQPGTIFWDFDTESMHVVCADGNLIGITHVKAEAKKVVRSYDFFNGYAVRSGQGKFGMFDNEEGVEPGVSGVQVTKRREDYTKSIKKRLKREAAKEVRMTREQRRRQESWDKSEEKRSRENAMNEKNEWDRWDRRDEWGVWDRQDKWEEKEKDEDNDVAGWNGRDRCTTTRWNSRESGRDRRKEGATAEWDDMEGDRDGRRKAASTEWNSREGGRDRRKEGATAEWDDMEGDRDERRKAASTEWNSREGGRDRRKEGATAEWDGMEGDRDGWRKAASTEWN
ncbi:formyl transferase, partial [Endogone sp. FLAS-F59071]